MGKFVASRSTWRFRYALGLFGLAVCLLSSCGGGGPSAGGGTPPSQPITVSISPSTASLKVGSTQQFTVTVTNTTNNTVTWSVNTISGGDATVGTISKAGLYTTPDLVPSAGSVTIQATSQADPTKSGTASVSLTYPAPSLKTIAPDTVTVGSVTTTLSVFGADFNQVSVVNLDGKVQTTDFVGPGELTIDIPASSQTLAGTHNVSVTNPAPGGGTTSTATFTVSNLVPALSSVFPAIVPEGSSDTRVSLNGANFMPTSTVSLGSSLLSSTYISASQLVVTVPASDLSSTGMLSLTASNPAPGGGASNSVELTVGNPPQGDVGPADESVGIDPEFFTYVIGSPGTSTSSAAVQKRATQLQSAASTTPTSTATPVFSCTPNTQMTSTSGGVCIAHVPYLPQMPPGTLPFNVSDTANCATASYLMVSGYYNDNQGASSACQTSGNCFDFPAATSGDDCSLSAQQIVNLLQNIDPDPQSTSCNPKPSSPNLNVTLSKAECTDPVTGEYLGTGDACLYYAGKSYGSAEYYGPRGGFALSTLAAIAQQQGYVSNSQGQQGTPQVAYGSSDPATAMNELYAELAQGYPVIVHVRYKMRQYDSTTGVCLQSGTPIPSTWSCSGHYMVLVGMDYDPNNVLSGSVYVNDPFPGNSNNALLPGEYIPYAKSDFLSSWGSVPKPGNGPPREYLVIYPNGQSAPVSLVASTLSFPGAQVGTVFTATVSAAFGTPPYKFSVYPTGSLPTGLNIDANSGTISGIPQQSGLFQFTVQVTDSKSGSAEAQASITVGSNPVSAAITTPSNLPAAEVGIPYSVPLTAAGSTSAFAWSVLGSGLPTGFSLTPNGVLTGTPTQAESSTSFTVQASSGGNTPQATTKQMAVSVVPTDLPPQIKSLAATPATVNSGEQSTLNCEANIPYEQSLTYGWTVSGGNISGTGPTVSWTAPDGSGTYTATCSVSDANGADSRSIVLSVSSAGLNTIVSPTTGVAGVTQFSVSGSGATASGGVTGTVTLPDGTTAISHATANSSGAFAFSPFTETQPGTYTEIVADDKTGAQSNVLVFTVTPSGVFNVSPSSWAPVFTIGDSAATIGFYITNQAGGSLTGTISATTSSGGQWLTVNGHASDSWVAPQTEEVTANPAGLAAGTYTGTITVSSPNPPTSVTIPVTMTIYSALQISTTALPDAVSGQPYDTQLHASGGTGTGYTWTLVSGTLPVGISFSSSGLLSGTAGSLSGSITESLTIAVQDSAGHQAINTFSLLWREGLAILPYSPSNFQFAVGSTYTASNSITLQAAGGTPPYTWTATGLPPGLTITQSSGVISGTPAQAGNFTANVTVTDSAGHSTTSPVVFTVVVTPLTITTGTLPSGTVGTSYSQSVNAQGGSQSGYTWSVQGTLPPGLSAASPSGGSSTAGLQISGTPTQAGTYPITVTVKDSLNDTAQQNLTIVMNTGSPPQITTSTLSLATVGSAYSFTLAATGGAGGYKWSFVGNSPDPDIQLSTDGVLSGTSTVANDCPSGPGIWVGSAYPSTYFQVQVTDSAGQSTVRQLCLPAYYPTPQITSLSPPSLTIDGQQHTITVNGSGFRNNAYIFDSGNLPTTYVSGQAISFVLSPAVGGAFSAGPSGPLFGDTTSQLWVVQPYSNRSNEWSFTIYDPAPTVSTLTAVLNNSNQPCTANANCQLVINGGGLVYDTTYTISETGQTLIRAAYPSTPIPWNTVTTSAFSLSAGTYTLDVTNPNQAGGGLATAVASFTVQ